MKKRKTAQKKKAPPIQAEYNRTLNKKDLKEKIKEREKELFKNELQKERFEEKQERDFYNHEKQQLFNYLLELLNDYEKKQLKRKPTKQEIETTFSLYEVKEISIDIIINNLKQANDHISGAIFQDLKNCYFRNYDTAIKKAINTKNYKEEKPRNNILKSSIIGFLIGKYFDKIILILVLGFFLLLATING